MSEDNIVQALVLRNEKVFRNLCTDYSQSLFISISQIVTDHHAAEEVLQTTFIKVWDRIHNYDRSKGRLFTWMNRIARHAAIDHIRARHAFCRVQSEPIETAAEVEVHTFYDSLGLKKLLAALEDKYQTVLQMVYFNGYTIRETACHLCLPEGTVKTRLRKSLILLRKEFVC